MAGTALVLVFAALAAVAAVQISGPAVGPSATRHSYAVAGFVLLSLSAVALLAQLVRGRAARRRGPPTDRLLDPSNRRTSFRLEYPEGEGPSFRLRGVDAAAEAGPDMEIRDLSVEGLRLRLAPGAVLPEEPEGEVRFAGGEIAPVAGDVVWRRGDEAALRLTRPLPAALFVAEQLRLKEYVRSRRGRA